VSESTGALGRVEQMWFQKRIDALVASSAGVEGVLICSADGFEVATNLPMPLSAATLSAMTSSQVALGEALCVESCMAPCVNVVIEAERGWLLMMDIPNQRRKLLLTAKAAAGSMLGQVLWAVRQCAQEIGARLDRSNAA
jgi:predicted regulator of Ras-like GTPase activity (Roadblock/LC7/MglB family)